MPKIATKKATKFREKAKVTKTFAAKLLRGYAAKKLTLADVAKKLGYRSYQSASRWIRGHGVDTNPRGTWVNRKIRWNEKALRDVVKLKKKLKAREVAQRIKVSTNFVFVLLRKAREAGIK